MQCKCGGSMESRNGYKVCRGCRRVHVPGRKSHALTWQLSLAWTTPRRTEHGQAVEHPRITQIALF